MVQGLGQFQAGFEALGFESPGPFEGGEGLIVALLPAIDFAEGQGGFVVEGVGGEEFFECGGGLIGAPPFYSLLRLLVEPGALRGIADRPFRPGVAASQDRKGDKGFKKHALASFPVA